MPSHLDMLLGVRARLLCLVFAALVPFVGFIAYQAINIRAGRIAEALDRSGHLAQIAIGTYEETVSEAKLMIEGLARSAATEGSASECGRRLASMLEARRWANGLFVVGSNGVVRCATVPETIGMDLSMSREFKAASAQQGFSVSDAFVGKVRKIPLAMVSIPFLTAHGDRALLSVTIDLSWFDWLSQTVGRRSNAKVVLLDGQGAVLSSYPKLGEALVRQTHLVPLVRGKEGQFEALDLDGKQAFVGFASVPDTNLRLLVSLEKDRVLANFKTAMWAAVALFIVVALGMSAFVWFAGIKTFVDPMTKLTALLGATLDNMDQGLIVVDATGHLPICNNQAQAMLNLPKSLMASRPHTDEVLAFQNERGDFESMCAGERVLVRPTEQGRTVYERETRDGRVLEIATVPFAQGGVVRTYTDITARKEHEKRLATSEARYRLMAQSCPDVIAQSDLEFRWQYVSPAIRQVLGLDPDHVVGRKFDNLLHPEDLEKVADARRRLLATRNPVPVAKRMRHVLGHWVWLEAELSLTLDTETGAPNGVVAVYRDVSARKAAAEVLARAHNAMEAMARLDGLTGLANRRQLDEALSREFQRAHRNGRPLSLIMLDVDHFKAFNDTYGHLGGDHCLKRVAECLKGQAKRAADLAGRFGGEEFALLLPETDAAGVRAIAEAICAAVEGLQLAHVGAPRAVVTVSIGCATYGGGAGGSQDLVRCADEALYEAKSSGRNCVRVHDYAPTPVAA